MSEFKCPKCEKSFKMNFFKWLFSTLIHSFSFKEWADYRLTRCPNCKEKSYIKREK